MHRIPLSLVAVVCTASAVLAAPVSAAATGQPWTWPLSDRDVGRTFERPADRYAAGHRGVDLPGRPGESVRAVAAGRVTFAGRVAGVPVVTVSHGAERSTYQPVAGVVRRGDAVDAGQVLGTLLADHGQCASACLHLGRLVGDDYLDPLELLRRARFRLVSPEGPPPAPPATAAPGAGVLRRPVGGPVTSAFGMRVHPVTGVRSLHDGTDFGVPCGTPVHASAAGTVTSSGTAGAYGLRVVLAHGGGLETSYSHLSRASVPPGAQVGTGDVVGLVGSSGMSTGCHLHFTIVSGGSAVDPMDLL